MAQQEKAKNTFILKRKLDEYRALDPVDKRRWWISTLTNNALYIILIGLIIFTAINRPGFLGFNNIIDMIKMTAASLFMALGVGGIIVLTGTDLSAGRAMGFTACISASLLQRSDYATKMWPNMETMNVLVVLLIVIVIGAVIGCFNGFFVSRFSLHPFIVTMSTQLMIYGGVLIYVGAGNNNGAPISGLSESYSNFVKGTGFNNLLERIGITGLPSIPNYIWYAVLMTVVLWIVWNKTTLGKNMYAVGSNPEAANVSGVNVAMTTIIIFTIAGAMYGMNGFIEAARVGSNNANTGYGAEMDAIAACVIGGVSFTGGVGKIGGIVVGVILLQVITVALQWLSVSAYWQYIIKGIIILAAVSIDMQKYLSKK